VFHEYFRTRDPKLTLQRGSNIEGIGRPRVEPSFVPGVIDHMITVPDAAAFATIRFLEGLINRKVAARPAPACMRRCRSLAS
jgi:cysteine synthase A